MNEDATYQGGCDCAYDAAFFEAQVRGALKSARIVVPIVLDLVGSVESVVDFGCGRGAWLQAFAENGVHHLLGIDGAAIDDVDILVDANCVWRRDLREPVPLSRVYDLAVCLEVAEHLPASAGSNIVRSLTGAAPLVLFSAAIPGQGGEHHINERWPDYWREVFDSQGFERLDPIRPRIRGQADIEWWYRQNIYLYVDKSNEAYRRLAYLQGDREDCIRVTIAVCTWNRSRLLDRTLSEMRELHIPSGVEWELLVVNNKCTDDTDAVIARHAHALPIRRLWEPKQGLSHARNRAVAEATGDLILWTDDDVLVDRAWLAEYVEAARRWPEATFFGGPIEPWFEVEPPVWIRRHLAFLAGLYAIRDLGPLLRRLSYHEHPWGASMAFRATTLKDLRFDERMGRSGFEMIGGEESGLMLRLARRGHLGVWVGTARVRHFIGSERLCARYAWNWFVGYGRTIARLDAMRANEHLASAPRNQVREHWKSRIRPLMSHPFAGPWWLVVFQRLAFLTGILSEAFASLEAAGKAADNAARVVYEHSHVISLGTLMGHNGPGRSAQADQEEHENRLPLPGPDPLLGQAED